jgi:tRNA/tmRNA/rRNA uracil-C5-methylase (TrmA/RlmC/RlmD family)
MQTIDILIEKIVYGGNGLARHEGRVVFVPGVAAGEKVRAKVVKDCKNFLEAELVEVLEASPERVEPPCAYIGKCGGCQYQHLSYAEELRWKEAQVRELMTRQGGVADTLIRKIVPSPNDYGYRSSVTLHRTRPGGVPQRMGFIGRDKTNPIIIDRCLLTEERLERVFRWDENLVRDEDRRTYRITAEGTCVTSRTEEFYKVMILGQEIIAATQGFFQNNIPVAEKMVQQTAAWLKELKATHVADLYSGVGLFGFLAAPAKASVTFVEDNPASVKALRMNVAARTDRRSRVHDARVESAFSRALSDAEPAIDALVIDPPRNGMSRDLCQKIADAKGIKGIVYISCDPATLARDLKILTADKRRRVEAVVPFDMFPRTMHIETMVFLR